ncbi:hypothetical protein [Nocardia wallacei]|uniref:hypothetical protein n=1 Tax=Nocardia wallacei TaxID=480035 RepID=UPI002455B6E6|nr:hypothetical protein [Nocardia wallacei]
MSSNEIDEIGRDTGRVFRQVIDVARTYIQRRRDHGRHAGVPRLSRDERRELAEQIRTRVGEQRVTEAWFTKRVEDYRRESFALRQRMARRPGVDMDAENARLNSMRYGIESNLLGTGLSLEQRGQIVQAMDRFDFGEVDRPFYGPQLFRKPTGRAAIQARDAAVRSERWVTERRAAVEQALPNDRERAVRDAAVRAADPEQVIKQGLAVQDLRHVQAVARDYGEGRDVRTGRRIATARARAAGLTPEQIRWELDNAEANSRTQVTVTAGSPGEKDRTWHTYHPTEAAAAQWVHDGVTEVDWRPGTTLTVKAREAGNPTPFYAVEGNQVEVGRDLELWQSETRDGFTHAQQREPDSRFHTRIGSEYGGTRREEFSGLHASEADAADWAARTVHSTYWGPGVDVTVTTADRHGGGEVHSVRGGPGFVTDELIERRDQITRDASTHAQQPDSAREQQVRAAAAHNNLAIQHSQVTAERDQLRGHVDALTTRLHLSIGHNNQLDEQNSQLIRQLTALTAERDRLRGQRDEAVQKLAERTPAAERYGSPERQAEQAKTAARQGFGAAQQEDRAVSDALGAEATRQAAAAKRDAEDRANAMAAGWAEAQHRRMNDLGTEQYYAEADARRQARDDAETGMDPRRGIVTRSTADGGVELVRDGAAARQEAQSLREWNGLVGENLAQAEVLQRLPESHIARRQLGEVEWAQQGVKGTEDVNEVASRWVNGGAEKYWAEADARRQARGAAHASRMGRSALADHQPGRTLADAVARNSAERDGAER